MVFVSHSQKHTHLQNTCTFTYIHTRSYTYLFPSHSSTGSWQFSLNLLPCIHTHTYVHKNTCTYISFLFQFLLCLCFATALTHTRIHTENSYSQSATSKNKNNCHNNNKNNNNTTTTTLRHYVSKRTHSYTQTTHAHACFMAKYNALGEAQYARALTLYAAPICPGSGSTRKESKRAVRAFKHPEILSSSSCRPKIYKQISLNNNWTWKLKVILFNCAIRLQRILGDKFLLL